MVISKLNNDIGAVLSSTVISEQKEQGGWVHSPVVRPWWGSVRPRCDCWFSPPPDIRPPASQEVEYPAADVGLQSKINELSNTFWGNDGADCWPVINEAVINCNQYRAFSHVFCIQVEESPRCQKGRSSYGVWLVARSTSWWLISVRQGGCRLNRRPLVSWGQEQW